MSAGCWNWKATCQKAFHSSSIPVSVAHQNTLCFNFTSIRSHPMLFYAYCHIPKQHWCPLKITVCIPFTFFLFRENDFEDGNHLYRFLEHEPTIPRCFNFRGSTNDSEPKPAAVVGRKLAKIMSAILEAYASEDCRHVDYASISKSEEFRR